MGLNHSPSIVTNGLTCCVDGFNSKSYAGSGTLWNDVSNNGTLVTLVGSPAFANNAFSFDGTSQYGVGAGTPLGINSYSKCVWFKLNTNFSSYSNNILSSSAGGHFMYFSGTQTLFCGHSNWANYLIFPSITVFAVNTWYCVCLTFDTTNGMKLYINGVLDTTYNSQLTGVSGTGQCNIGCYGEGGNLLNGLVGQAAIYNRALTAQEVLQNYNALKGRYI
jgi:hypothetical protein